MVVQPKEYSAVFPLEYSLVLSRRGRGGCPLALKLTCFICLLLLHTDHAFAQKRDTMRVFFELDKNNLTEQASYTIDSLIKNKVLERGKKVILLGFGDYLGTSAYNDELSYSRAKNVADYLALAGFMRQDITLIVGKGKIGRTANGKGYATDRKVEIIFDRRIDTPAKEKFYHYLYRLKENETVALKNIHFYRGSLRITPASLSELELLWDFMNEHKTWTIQLEGHVCCLGLLPGRDEPYDESTLSQKRAETIRDSLVAHGVDKSRVLCVGLGNNDPLNDEETLEEQELNRRVEVRVISK